MNKVNALHVITQLPGGGVERILVDLLPQLNRDSFNINVCCIHRRGALADVLEEQGIPVCLVRLGSRWDPAGIYQLSRLMRRQRIEIVHTHMYASSISGTVAARLAKVPVIIANMHSLHEWHSRRRVWMAVKLFNSVDTVVAVSNCVRQDLLQKLGLDKRKVITIHNGVELTRFTPPREAVNYRHKLGLRDGELVVGAVGRLVHFKGFGYLLEAAKIICSRTPKFRLVIVGGGELGQELKQKAEDLGIAEKVIFTGRQEDVLPFLASFDVAVVPSVSEGFGIVVLEAMAIGKAVVASRVGGIPEVVEDGVTGVLVPAQNPSALAEAITKLIASPELRRAMGQAGRARVERLFSMQRVVEQTVNLYHDLLQQKGHKF